MGIATTIVFFLLFSAVIAHMLANPTGDSLSKYRRNKAARGLILIAFLPFVMFATYIDDQNQPDYTPTNFSQTNSYSRTRNANVEEILTNYFIIELNDGEILDFTSNYKGGISLEFSNCRLKTSFGVSSFPFSVESDFEYSSKETIDVSKLVLKAAYFDDGATMTCSTGQIKVLDKKNLPASYADGLFIGLEVPVTVL